MAEIRCPNCGRSNPDLLEVCQFCQAPLKPESVLHIGEQPTKKNTGELESVLPDWLKDVRQQAKDAAQAEEAAQTTASSKSKKDEPTDLLAGLSQASRAEEEDVPDWLASLNPAPQPPAAASSGSNFFERFNRQESELEQGSEPPQEEGLSWMGGLREKATIPSEKDELSEWFTQASGQSEETEEADREQSEQNWRSSFDSPAIPERKAPLEEEDLSWLHNLEAAAKQTGDLQSPKKETGWTADLGAPSTPSESSEDLSWLDRLGGIEETSQPAPEEPAAPANDLSWLDQFAGARTSSQPSEPAAPEPASEQDLSWLDTLAAASEPPLADAAPNQAVRPPPLATGEDLDWLNKLGGIEEPAQPAQAFSVPEESPSSAAEDLSWLNDLGKPGEPSAPDTVQPSAQEDLSWLKDLGAAPEPLSTPPFAPASENQVPPRQTAPLGKQPVEATEPDWLKRATQGPSMPAPGDLSMDWFSSSGQADREKTPPAAPKVSPFESDIFSSAGEPASLSNQDVDSLFSVDLPDWLSRPEEEETVETASPKAGAMPTESDESLAPVDLPSWVQAMRPVEAVITETTPRGEDLPAETEGPLAGLHGVIPIAPLGSARRPKPISLTLQTSNEQQASALLLEQILGSETSPRSLIGSAIVTSQQWLRWALSGLFLLVLSAVILLRSQLMPVSPNLSQQVGGLSNAVLAIPANSSVLVVIDYEPSLAGELQAIGGPLLDQIVRLSQPRLSFVATSPNGVALAERLMADTGMTQTGLSYANLGYLPGGTAGVLGFIEGPGQILPAAGVQSFSQYAALVILTDHAESGRVWVEQLQNRKAVDPALANQPLLVIASAQAGPLLQPYVSSRQITGMISGLPEAAGYEAVSNSHLVSARSYWDAFGIGLMAAVTLIIFGSLWSLYTGVRARRASAGQG